MSLGAASCQLDHPISACRCGLSFDALELGFLKLGSLELGSLELGSLDQAHPRR